jgi:hypothetical protein
MLIGDTIMKKLIMILCIFGASTGFLSAQLLLSDFDSYSNDADFVYNNGQWTDSQGSGVMTITSGNGFGNTTFEFLSAQDYSGYADAELQLTVGGSNVSSTFVLAIFNTSFAQIASATFNASTGTQTATLNITGNMADAGSWAIAGNGTTDAVDVSFGNLALVPEPSSFALMGLGGAALYLLRRRRR